MKYVNNLKQIVQAVHPEIQVNSVKVPGQTGCFEVIILGKGKENLIHSKLGGEGFVTDSNKNAFLKKLSEAL